MQVLRCYFQRRNAYRVTDISPLRYSIQMYVTLCIMYYINIRPITFILYINDIVKVSTVLNPVLFADDTSLFHAHTDFDTLIEEINEELQKITNWFHTNKLSLNIKKPNFIIFLPKGKKCNTENVKININGNEIKRVNFTHFLGIYIDEHLS